VLSGGAHGGFYRAGEGAHASGGGLMAGRFGLEGGTSITGRGS
jgi:hypothetical protein